MTLEALLQEIQALTVDERKQLVMAILDSFTEESSTKTHNATEFEGIAAHLRDRDSQAYVNELRQELDDRL